MTSANILQKDDTRVLYAPLPAELKNPLRKTLQKLKHSQKMQAYREMNLAPDTVKKALAGLDVKPETEEKVRTYLNNNNYGVKKQHN